MKSDMKLSEVKNTHSEIEKIMLREFHVVHVTLQFEYDTDHAPHLIHKEEG